MDNGDYRIAHAWLGALSGVDTTTRGTYYFDAFESRREEYIGGVGDSLMGGLALSVANEWMLAETLSITETLITAGTVELLEPVVFSGTIETWDVPEMSALAISTGSEMLAVEPSGFSSELQGAGMLLATQPVTITYDYDPLGRLTVMTDTNGVSFDFSYDPVGNRLSQEVVLCEGCQAQTTDYTYDDANRLSTVGVITYTWDANGNLLDDGVKTYGYNHANRLVSVTDGQTTVVYNYNELGNRISQTVNSVTTQYTLDLNTALTQVLAGDDGSRYVYGLGRLAQSGQSGAEYFLTDAIGSVRQITDSNGEVTLAQTYQPFGDILTQDGEGRSPYGFTGEWQETDAGLIHLRARYYSPAQGRFVSRDTWTGDPMQPMSYNSWLYGYANPIMYTDPSGNVAFLAALVPALVGAGVTIGGAVIAGGIFGYCTYELAIAGDCGCELQQQALSMSKWEDAGANALSAGFVATTALAMATSAIASPLGAIVVGGIGLVVSWSDLVNTVNIIKNEAGLTWCTLTRMLLDIAGIVFSTIGIVQGVRAWRTSGSLLTPLSPIVPINARGLPYPDVEVPGYGKVPFPKGPYVPNNTGLRAQFTKAYKLQFKTWWIKQGRPWPNGTVIIHHIKPLQYGGTNIFENLIPLLDTVHPLFNNWWRNFIP